MYKTLPSIILAASLSAAAQQPEDLSASHAFFEKAANNYQLWLDGNGLGTSLHVQEFQVKGDTQLVLFLRFPTENSDSVKAIWEQARADFYQKTGGDALETVLFEKLAWYFEVPREQARLYLRDSYSTPQAKCWEARIKPENGEPVFQQRPLGCKSQDFEVEVRPSELTGLNPTTRSQVSKKLDKRTVFAELEKWAGPRFSKPQPDGGWSHILFKDRWNNLVFDVDELRKEVLTDECESWVCQTLCQCPTCIKRERMSVKIGYEPLDDGSGGFRLKVNVAAAYGSAIWKPREGGWHDLDLESDKKALLKNYGEKLMFEMKTVLLKKP